MKEFQIEGKELFSLLTSKQVSEISDIAEVRHFAEKAIVFNEHEYAGNLFILLEGEVVLTLSKAKGASGETLFLEIDRIEDHGIFGSGLLFGIEHYVTRATVERPSKIMILDSRRFLEIIRENKSEFPIMAYLARVYFRRYIHAMEQFARSSQEEKQTKH